MKNVYVISLIDSLERRKALSEEMKIKGIDFEFFDAIDGRKSTPWLASDYDYVKRLWFTSGKMPSKGELGCYASHYLLWIKCIELNRPIIVCEDDIKLSENAKDIVKIALDKVEKYGFIRLEPVVKNGEKIQLVEENQDVKISLMKNNFGGLRAYAISPQAAIRLIKHRWCYPVDCFVGANFIHKQFSFILSPYFIAEHDLFQTTIQDEKTPKAPFYRKITRELYSLYKKIILEIKFRKKIAELKNK